MEPKNHVISRDSDILMRHPGDGEENFAFDSSPATRYNTAKVPHKYKTAGLTSIKTPNILSATPHSKTIDQNITAHVNSDVSLHEDTLRDTEINLDASFERSTQDLLITIDTLKTKLKLCEDHNSQLIEEKLRLSQQLGVQTQVNNEVKKLLVASIGEDLQQNYERLIQDKAQVDSELHHLRNVMQEDREEVEQAMIQSDVWRSKFLASRVMNDELARWKSALYYKYRESHSALQNLLEEHSKIRALNNSTKRGLVLLAEILNCKDPSLDSKTKLTTIDVAFINNDLAEALCEVMKENKERTTESTTVIEKIEIKDSELRKEKGKKNLANEILIEANELTPAEQLAHEVVINPSIQTKELSRMRRDYMAHNRISHFLSTNYHVTFNCCENCKGPVHLI